MSFRRLRKLIATVACAIVMLSSMAYPATVTEQDRGIDVHVEIRDATIVVDADVSFAATQSEVWAVLTDFDHLPDFISNLKSSKIIAREGNVVQVAQTGTAHFGLLSFDFHSIRELNLRPEEGFESRQIKGNMKQFRGITKLEVQGAGTHLHYHAEALPDTMLPIGFGSSVIATETREHYREIRNEVVRRHGAATSG